MAENTNNTPDGGETTPKEGGEPAKKTFTQEELDSIVKDRLARERGKYKDYDELRKKATRLDEIEVGELDELGKLRKEIDGHKSTLSTKDTELSGLKLENAKIRALIKAGTKPEQIDEALPRIIGTTSEEIEADVIKLKMLGWIGQAETPTVAQGAGNLGVLGTPGKKTWTKTEIQRVAKTADAKTLEDINLAQREGRVNYNQ